MLVLNLPFKALMFLTLMRPSLVLFLVLWLKLVKDFLKVRCRLALLPFLISCLIWLDLVASLPLIKERILDGRRVRNRRQLNSLQNTWPYGYSMPIAVRYTQDAFSRSGWLWPVDAKGEPLKATSYMAVGFYVAKYV